MPRPEPVFDGTEGDVLIEIYEWPDVPFSSYTLTQRLNPNLQTATPEYRTAFAHVNSVIEDHFVRGLIRRKRSKSADGVFFNNLKLTYKGEQAAIQERNRRTEQEKVKQLLDVAALIRGDAEKK
ncbi:MAG: hypothetical protein ABSE79_17135 [Terriglobia bacterium]|jgi:hypothetical protein